MTKERGTRVPRSALCRFFFYVKQLSQNTAEKFRTLYDNDPHTNAPSCRFQHRSNEMPVSTSAAAAKIRMNRMGNSNATNNPAPNAA